MMTKPHPAPWWGKLPWPCSSHAHRSIPAFPTYSPSSFTQMQNLPLTSFLGSFWSETSTSVQLLAKSYSVSTIGFKTDQHGVEQGEVNSGDFYKIYSKSHLQMAQNSLLGAPLSRNIVISAIGRICWFWYGCPGVTQNFWFFSKNFFCNFLFAYLNFNTIRLLKKISASLNDENWKNYHQSKIWIVPG